MKNEEDLESEDLQGLQGDLPPEDGSEETPPGPDSEETPPDKGDTVEGLREQMKAMREEMKNFQMGVQQELSQAQNEAAYYRGLAQRGKEQEGMPGQPEAEPEIDQNQYYQDPIAASRKIAQDEIRKARKEAAEQARDYRLAELRRAYDTGRDTAIKQFPKLFQGIEREVEDLAYRAIQAGRLINPRDVESTATWATLAEAVRRAKGELDFGKYYQRRLSPLSEPFSETPTGARGGTRGNEVVFDEETELLLKAINKGEKKPITKEEVAQAYKSRTTQQRRTR